MSLPAYGSIFRPEPLPTYSAHIDFRGKLLCKPELQEPHTPAFPRRWQRVVAELRGTTLILYLSPAIATIETFTPTRVRRYTLQYADAGLAPDYKRRADAFRVRVEGEQLLFIAPGSEAAVTWVDLLLAATAISQPLDQWSMPRYPGLPGRAVKIVGPSAKTGIGGRLMTELSWQARQREEWLLDVPSRPRKERWREVLHGSPNVTSQSVAKDTANSTTTQAGAAASRRASSTAASSSGGSCTSCPCSSCWSGIGHGTSQSEQQDSETSPEVSVCLPSVSPAESSRRSARILPRDSAWNGDYYVKEGRLLKIQSPVMSTGHQAFGWGQREQGNNLLRIVAA